MSGTNPDPTRFSLEGRVALVVGGTSGIGLAIASALAEAGADVVASSRRAAETQSACAQIERLGRRSLARCCDVEDRASLEGLRDEILRRFGAIDILVNCAGRTGKSASLEVSEQEWQAILATNLTGTWRSCQVFAAPMLERGAGRVINIASLASFVGLFQVAAYTASKAGVAGLTRALAVEWGPLGVNVNAIAPGVFPTPLNRSLLEGTARGEEFIARTPLRRFGEVAELGGAAVYLASPAASFVNGAILNVDGGFLASGVNC